VVKFLLEEVALGLEAEPKVPFSTSLPEALLSELAAAARILGRDKALLVRTALSRFFDLDRTALDGQVLAYYQAAAKEVLRAFTTTLAVSQKRVLAAVSLDLHRPKTDLIRSALHGFLRLSPTQQEKAIREHLLS